MSLRGGVLERGPEGIAWVVFGTLLGPETTGPGGKSPGTCVSGFLAAPITRLFPFAGGVCGVCGTGLLFENYIVDASIFYKKQFPRNMNLDLCRGAGCAFLGCGRCCGVVSVVLSKLLLDLLWSSF